MNQSAILSYQQKSKLFSTDSRKENKMSTLLVEKVVARLNRVLWDIKEKGGKIKWRIGGVRYTLDTDTKEAMAYNEKDELLLINEIGNKDYGVGGQLESFIIGAQIMDAMASGMVEAAMKIAR
jgi:hypothetical protein